MRFANVSSLALLVATVAWAANLSWAANTPSIKEIMGKLNKGPTSMTPTLGKALKEDEPGWDAIQKTTKEFVELAECLGKNEPPKGDKKSWEKLTNDYARIAKELDAAVRKKNKEEAQLAHVKLTQACKNCHLAHKGP
jgi:hypothetical protein